MSLLSCVLCSLSKVPSTLICRRFFKLGCLWKDCRSLAIRGEVGSTPRDESARTEFLISHQALPCISSRVMFGFYARGSCYLPIVRRLSTMSLPPINTAAILVIGDEVLNGKIKDTNSQFFAQYCFELGIDLRRINVVPDNEADIIETLHLLREKYDFIVTTGGIGPTHDDITYESIAKAFNLPLKLDSKTVEKMDQLSKYPPSEKKAGSEELKAQLRMATFPDGPIVSRDFLSESLWVPVVNINRQVYIFPGIPALYRQMMEDLRPHIAKRVSGPKLKRRYISTTTVESVLASAISEIHNKFSAQGIKIGSYPHFRDHRNTVSILGPEEHSDILQQIVEELLPKLENSCELSPEEEAASA